MEETGEIKVPWDLRRKWDEVRLCADLLRRGQAVIVAAERKDGIKYRYTKPG